MPRYVKAADILIHLSLREVYLELLFRDLLAKPAIAFGLDGAPEVVKMIKPAFFVIELVDDVTEALELCQSSTLRKQLGASEGLL